MPVISLTVPKCKAEVAKYESMGGFYLKNHEELKVSKSLWNNVLNRIDGLEQEENTTNFIDHKVQTSLCNSSIRIPSFLHNYLDNKKYGRLEFYYQQRKIL